MDTDQESGMDNPEPTLRPCWCGNDDLRPYSPEYQACDRCGTLVSQLGLTEDTAAVRDDEQDYYGKSYWQDHQSGELRLPRIEERARTDLIDRCARWLRILLRYQLPPGKVLELGCSHGGFVAQLRAVGFDAAGLELSPWVVSFARRTFGVPMLQGPIEEQQLEPGSYDVLVLNDLLEHLPDPVRTLGRCAELLKPDGLLVLQTPCYPEGRGYEELLAEKAPFLEMMSRDLAREHIYLFSRKSVARLLGQFGLNAIQFEPPAFVYDMYLFAGRAQRSRHDEGKIRDALQATPAGRLIESHLDAVRQMEQYRTELWEVRQRAQLLEAEAQAHIAEQNRLRDRLSDRDDLGPTAIRISRVITRAGGRFPRLALMVKRVIRR